jgi:hypothetical protein
MTFEHGLRYADIACENDVGEMLVRGHELRAVVKTPHHHAPVAVGLIVEVGMRRKQPP